MINFSGKVIIDKNFRPPKNIGMDEIISYTKKIVEHPILGEMFDDVAFTNSSNKREKGFVVKFDRIDIHFVGDKITAGDVFQQLLVRICSKNNIPWYMETEEGRIKFFKQLIDKHFQHKK